MKMKTGAGSGLGIGTDGRRERADVLQQKRRRSHHHAGHKNLWGREQCVELSRLVLGFARQHSRLPDVGDRGFWQLCHDTFRGVFTHKQVQAKARYMHLRFRRFASGAGARFCAADGHILKIWTHIVQQISPSSSVPSSHSPLAQDSVSEMSHGHARGHPGVGPEKKGANQVSGAPPAARQEPHQEASACSTEIVHEYYEEEVHSQGEFRNNAEKGDAASGAADDDFAKNNALLHHLTVADLAAAVKTLAEIVARGPLKV